MTTAEELQSAIKLSYKSALLRQFYKLLLRVDMLSVPVRLVSGVGQGVRDFGAALLDVRSGFGLVTLTLTLTPTLPLTLTLTLRRARSTPRTSSSPPSRAASCSASARPPSPSTVSTSRRTLHSSGGSSRCSWRSRRCRRPPPSCAG